MEIRPRAERDIFGKLLFSIHVAVILFVLVGWAAPVGAWLISYLIFLPALAAHWSLNAGECALNNFESWMRYRRWRAPEQNPEEGAWLRTLLVLYTGLVLQKREMDIVLHTGLILLWAIALVRFWANV
jgi:hypothetical protein